MLLRNSVALSLLFLLYRGCGSAGQDHVQDLKYKAVNGSPEVLAVYEGWFGHPSHMPVAQVGYSSHDPAAIERQIKEAKAMGIDGFVVDWYGDREPFIDKSYQLVQEQAERNRFKVAMMYDESRQEDGATDEAIADFTMFRDTYLSPKSPGHKAYLTYQGRPVFFIFPTGRHTDWDKVRAVLNTWNPAPILIQENLPGQYANDFDGFYAWVQPGEQGWKPDGSNWGQQYLDAFYRTMGTKYPDKIIVGGAWAQFDDSKASWGLNRHIAARCGNTFKDTFNEWRTVFPPNNAPPFLLVETWNDHEEGTAIEGGLPSCGSGASNPILSAKR